MGVLLQLVVLAVGVRLPAGQPAPQLEALTFEGNPWSQQLTGRVTIVDFFATWCPHCRESLAGYARLKQARDVQVIIVDVEEEPAFVVQFFAHNSLPGGVSLLLDPTGAASRTWRVTGFPTAYLIDQNGVIRGSWSGWGEGSLHRLVEEIDDLQRPAPSASSTPRTPAAVRGPKRPAPRAKQKVPARATTLDERARQMGVEVIR
jgi:thiol-disulfide isomerase/thioredoxin